jgi:hypothetical protein
MISLNPKDSCALRALGYATHLALSSPNLDVRKLIGYGECGGSLDERVVIVARIQVDRGSDRILHAE